MDEFLWATLSEQFKIATEILSREQNICLRLRDML